MIFTGMTRLDQYRKLVRELYQNRKDRPADFNGRSEIIDKIDAIFDQLPENEQEEAIRFHVGTRNQFR